MADESPAVRLAAMVEAEVSPARTALEWYHSKGKSLFERSTLGAILDRLIADSQSSRRCRRCNDAPQRSDGGEQVHLIDPTRDGGSPGVLPDGSWCPECNGNGYVGCSLKRDSGARTAQPTGHEVRSSGYTPSDGDLTRLARVTRWLMRLERKDPRLSQALEAYYGDDSLQVAGLAPWGRWLAVIPGTGAWPELATRSKTEREVSLRPVERMRSIAALELSQSIPWRRSLLDLGMEQASAQVRDGTRLIDTWIREEL